MVHGCLTLTDIPEGTVTLENVRMESCVNAGLVLRKAKPAITGLWVTDSPIGVLLDGVPSSFVDPSFGRENVATAVLEGPSYRLARAKH